MPLVQLVITLIVVGVLLWAVNTYIPMDPKIRQILNIVVVIVVVLWLLRVFGVLETARGIRIGAAGPPSCAWADCRRLSMNHHVDSSRPFRARATG